MLTGRRLGRGVAIKILPAVFTSDPERPTRLPVVLNWSEELKRRETLSSSGEGGLR